MPRVFALHLLAAAPPCHAHPRPRTPTHSRFGGRGGRAWLLPLHSAISADQQRAAFKAPPPGVRKVVLATNIAETSVTLEDVTVVIDCGRHKERRFDAHKR
jgi:ATP-dependent RNA helicase DHX29